VAIYGRPFYETVINEEDDYLTRGVFVPEKQLFAGGWEAFNFLVALRWLIPSCIQSISFGNQPQPPPAGDRRRVVQQAHH